MLLDMDMQIKQSIFEVMNYKKYTQDNHYKLYIKVNKLDKSNLHHHHNIHRYIYKYQMKGTSEMQDHTIDMKLKYNLCNSMDMIDN